ncbi:MAG: chorismate synthase [Thermomicrobia bacterium]|nr:chorismate synthase [Thermomicrobia bacterium]
MNGNSFGQVFRITTFGESHGRAVGVTIDGCPAGLAITTEMIQTELNRRRTGQSHVTTPRQEKDQVEILSGLFEGETTGMPVTMIVWNEDADSSKYERIRELYRPGHADYTYTAKYGRRDHRGGGRSSARETIGRVAAGAVAKALLTRAGVTITGYTVQVGDVVAREYDPTVIERNVVRAADLEASERMDKLDADIAKGMMSVPATKAFEIGDGFAVVDRRASVNNDPFVMAEGVVRTTTNHAGGILGGISTGEPIVVRVAIKPPSSITKEQMTIDRAGNPQPISVEGRHDPCLAPRAVPVLEAMLALVLADHLLRQRLARVAWEDSRRD